MHECRWTCLGRSGAQAERSDIGVTFSDKWRAFFGAMWWPLSGTYRFRTDRPHGADVVARAAFRAAAAPRPAAKTCGRNAPSTPRDDGLRVGGRAAPTSGP